MNPELSFAATYEEVIGYSLQLQPVVYPYALCSYEGWPDLWSLEQPPWLQVLLMARPLRALYDLPSSSYPSPSTLPRLLPLLTHTF